MSEPDHIFLKALPNFVTDDFHGICFPFFYIDPKLPSNKPLIEKVLGREMKKEDLEKIDGTGNSPVIISKEDFKKIAPKWHDYTLFIHNTPELKKAWGWVLEMWAYTLAAYENGIRHIMYRKFMAQPPWDTENDGHAILHYTYGIDTDLEGNRILNGTYGQWRFDKRSYYHDGPKRNLTVPPKAPELIRTLIEMINEASYNTPTWNMNYGSK